MGILDMIAKSVFEAASGRIRWQSNMWALIGSRWDRERLVNKNLIGGKHVNMKGEWIEKGRTLVKRLCTSRCPKPPGSDFYTDGKLAWVPATECRKCSYHRKAGSQHLPFPRCMFNRSEQPRDIAAQTFSDLHKIATQAGEQVKAILK